MDHTHDHTWIGIDVSKNSLDVFSIALGHFKVLNTAEGTADLIARLSVHPFDGIVMEATGGYEQALFQALNAQGLSAVIANPLRVRKFAEGSGKLAKTDRIDAEVLAAYGAYMRPAPTAPKGSFRAKLHEFMIYREQLNAEINARGSQLRVYLSDSVKTRAEQALLALKTEKKILDHEIEALIKSDSVMTETYTILTSMPGVGLAVAAMLIADAPELGRLSRRQIASLIGLAPFPRDSGQRRGYRAIRGGRAEIRTMLYNAARVAVRHNAEIMMLVDRLNAKGKPFKVMMVAVMRKILTMLNAMMKSGSVWKHPLKKRNAASAA